MSVGAVPRVDGDHHVHSTYSDDAVSTLAENLDAARRAGLRVLRLVDHVRTSTTWVPEMLAAVRALPRVDGLEVRTGVEAKVLDVSGAVDAPPAVLAAVGTPDGPDRVLLADHQVPGTDGPWSPSEAVRRMVDGRVGPTDVVELVVTGTIRAVERVGRAQLAHPFSVLPKVGLSEDDVPDDVLDALAAVLVRTGTPAEVNEKWRCPGPRVRERWAAAGVLLVAATDAHVASDVGVYRWVGEEP